MSRDTDPKPQDVGSATATELPYALLAHPLVQGLRFLTKAALAWLLTAQELGDAMLVGLFVFLAQHVALFGLDDAIVFAPRLTRRTWRALRRFLHGTGLLLALGVAGTGQWIAWRMDAPSLGTLALVLAPTVWIGNHAVMPTALLVRARRFRRVFLLDAYGVAAFAITTLVLSSSEAGAWSLVAGWYANALTAVVVAHTFARDLRATVEGEAEETRTTLRYGAHLTGASLLGFASERFDSFAVGLGIGRAALGLYEWALHLSQFTLQYASNLTERFLFPTLAEGHRRGAMLGPFREALRLCNTFVMPLHVTLAVAAAPFVHGFLPRGWSRTAPLLAVLALAAGWQSLDVIARAALKATGASGTIVRLSVARLALLVLAVALALPRGLFVVACAVLAARFVGAVIALLAVGRVPEIRAAGVRRLAAAGLSCFLFWVLLYLPAAWLLRGACAGRPRLELVGTVGLALAVWLVVRVVLDRAALHAEWSRFRARPGVVR